MNRKIAPFIDIVRLEDKETKLKSFVRSVVNVFMNELRFGVVKMAYSTFS